LVSFAFILVAISVSDNSNPSAGKHREAENIIHESLEGSSKLDTVAYNTFIKAMLEAGIYKSFKFVFEATYPEERLH
jgi:hypothetical protein